MDKRGKLFDWLLIELFRLCGLCLDTYAGLGIRSTRGFLCSYRGSDLSNTFLVDVVYSVRVLRAPKALRALLGLSLWLSCRSLCRSL